MLREDAPDRLFENITSEDVEELRRLARPPLVVQHTLEACFLILHASSFSLSLAHPQWARVQRKLADVDFLQELLRYDASILRSAPLLTSYIASEYFGMGVATTSLRMSKKDRARPRELKVSIEPLTFQRVYRASQAAAALFRWCALVFERAAAMAPEDVVVTPAEEESEDNVEPWVPVVMNVTKKLDDGEDTVDPFLPIAQEQESVTESVSIEETLDAFRKKFRLRAWQGVCVALRPDRHFEELVFFCVGRSRVDKEHFLNLRNIVRAMRLRPSLQLHLMGCHDALEGELASNARISSLSRFFGKREIPVVIEGRGRTATISNPSGIVCKLCLGEERQLRDYFRARDRICQDSKSSISLMAILLPVVATHFLEEDASTVDSLALASHSHHNAFKILMTVCPPMTIIDVLFSMWLEAVFQTFLY